MKYLLIGDLHLTDRPRDAYRFGIFKWIREQQARYEPDATIFMGDLTDKKDNHSAALINRIIDELGKDDYVLMGNHDYIDPKMPFFRFLEQFIHTPRVIGKALLLPHTHSEDEFARWSREVIRGPIDYVFCHQTFDGAIAETGKRLNGFRPSLVNQFGARLGVYAGDVHKPQRGADVVYVGAPYHIRFGDNFTPRCLVIPDNGEDFNIEFDTVMKWSLTVNDAQDILSDVGLRAGDQVKVTVELAREETVEWKTIRKEIVDALKSKRLEIFGVDLLITGSTPKQENQQVARTPTDILSAFCQAENLSSRVRQAGHSMLKVN